MPFHFKKKESVAKGVRRICCERLDIALESLGGDERLEAIHDVRKEIKKLRAILRLVRGEIGNKDYRKCAKALRKTTNHLAALRDAKVRLDAFGNLTRHSSREISARPFPKIKKTLQKNCRQEEGKFLKDNSVAAVNRILKGVKQRVGDLKIRSDGWAAIYPGLRQIYYRGQKTYKTVLKEPSPENFHEWRKRVKDLWCHLRLLCRIWPKELRAAADELKSLGEFLGDDHDLAMLEEFAARKFMGAAETKALAELIGSRQKELRSAALKSGAHFYSEKPEFFCQRLESHWKRWRGGK